MFVKCGMPEKGNAEINGWEGGTVSRQKIMTSSDKLL